MYSSILLLPQFILLSQNILVENHSPSRGSGTSLHNRGATLIRIQNTQLRIPSHPAYVARRHAYANLSSTNFPNLEPSLRHPRIQYTSQSGTLTQMGLEPQEGTLTQPPESTRYSRHLSTPSARLSVPGLEASEPELSVVSG